MKKAPALLSFDDALCTPMKVLVKLPQTMYWQQFPSFLAV